MRSSILIAFLTLTSTSASILPLPLKRTGAGGGGLLGGLLGGRAPTPTVKRSSSLSLAELVSGMTNFEDLRHNAGFGLGGELGLGRRQGLPAPSDLPAQCQTNCTGPIENINSCNPPQPSCLCSAEFQQDLFNCYECLGNAVSSSNFTIPQENIDGITTACDNAGVTLPKLTFPGQDPKRVLSTTSVSGTKTGTFSVTSASSSNTASTTGTSTSGLSSASSSAISSSSTINTSASASSSTGTIPPEVTQTVPSVLPSQTSSGNGATQTNGAVSAHRGKIGGMSGVAVVVAVVVGALV